MTWLILTGVCALLGIGLTRLSRRSGVTSVDLANTWPGDDLITNPTLSCDRAAIINASAEDVWPWIVQLGKGRGGWYAPRWVEYFFWWQRAKWGARMIRPEFQTLAAGEIVPDWGGGSLKVVTIDPPKTLVHLGIRGQSHPQPFMSWVHIIEPIDATQCRLYTRLRGRLGGPTILAPLRVLGGFFDYLTIVVMIAGLRERLHSAN